MLDWRPEYCAGEGGTPWHHRGTNLVMDFHGDPAAPLVVFSDGNHHMALLEAVCAFQQLHGVPVFYTTTPPGPLVAALRDGALIVGNLRLALTPHVFISPAFVHEPLRAEGRLGPATRLFRSRGNVLLVPAGNPQGLRGIPDLARSDVTVFLSNPTTEKASYSGYRATLDALAAKAGIDLPGLTEADPARIRYGERIHHREAPEAVASGRADCALVYHHLGLRYSRVFGDRLESVSIEAEGTPQVASSHLALVDGGGRWGRAFMDFMCSAQVGDIYRYHGMEHG